VAINQVAHVFLIGGLCTDEFLAGVTFHVIESTGNDGWYTVGAIDAFTYRGNTVVIVIEAIPDATADGRAVRPVARVGAGPLKRYKGVGSGRRVREDGTVEIVLGVDEDGEAHEMTTGDYVEVMQSVDLTDVDLIRVAATAIPVALASPLVAWRGRILVQNVAVPPPPILLVERDVSPQGDNGVEWTDFVAPVRRYTGDYYVFIRFEFVEV
jgi:hypothetical protein